MCLVSSAIPENHVCLTRALTTFGTQQCFPQHLGDRVQSGIFCRLLSILSSVFDFPLRRRLHRKTPFEDEYQSDTVVIATVQGPPLKKFSVRMCAFSNVQWPNQWLITRWFRKNLIIGRPHFAFCFLGVNHGI